MAQELMNILVNHVVNTELKKSASRYLTGSLVDIGCGTKPYRKLLAPHVTEHIGVDHRDTVHDKTHIDLIGSAYAIPVHDASFDSALCTAVLEHVEEPEQALRECYRVLKSKGVAVYTVPFIWHLHEEPRDFFRYSKHGIKYLFEKAGFEVLEIKALSGFWVTFGQLFVYNIYRFNIGPLRWFRIIDALGLILQGLAYVCDKFDKTEQWTWMYMVVARKS